MKHVHTLPNIEDYEIESLDDLKEVLSAGIIKAFNGFIHEAMQRDDTCIYFAAIHSIDSSDTSGDPLTVNLSIAERELGDDQPTYSFNLRDSLESYLDDCKEDGSGWYGLSRISSELRVLADQIDAAIDSAKKDGHID